MSRKRVLIVAGALFAIVIVAALALPMLVDANKYRGLVQTKAEAALGRRVTLGPMSLSVLPTFGLRVDDLEVERLLRARRLTVGVRILPLLFGGAVDVRKVILEQPEITATRDASGKWSFEGLGGAGGNPPGTGAAPSAPRPFSLGRLAISGGKLHLRDERHAQPVALDLDVDLDGSVKGSGAGDLDATFDGRLSGDRLALDLRGSFQRPTAPGGGGFDITIDKADADMNRARDLVRSFGQAWPIPDGLLAGQSLKTGGHLVGTLRDGALASLAVTDPVVNDADIHLSRDRRGTWNFESLLGSGTPPAPAGAGPAPAFDLSVKNLRLGGAKVSLHDEAVSATPVDIRLNDLMLVVEELRRDQPMKVQLTANAEPGGGGVEMGGSVPLSAAGPLDARVDLKHVDARTLGPYLKQFTDLDATSGTVTLHLEARGDWPRHITAAGSLALDSVKSLSGRSITAQADYDMGVQQPSPQAATQIQLQKLDLRFGGSRIAVRGGIARGAGATIVDLEIPRSSIDAADLASLAALAGVKSPVEFSSSRPVSLEARVKGDLAHRDTLDLSGSLEVADFTFKLPMMDKPMEQVRGRVTLRGKGFEVTGFSGVIGRSDLSGTLTVDQLDPPRATFALASKRADFWELMSFMKKDETAAAAAPSDGGAGTGAGGGDAISRLVAHGTLSIGQGSFGTLAFSDLTSTLGVESYVVRLDPVSLKLYGGSVAGSASMDMNRTPVVYAISAKPSGVDTDALLAANLQMKGMLTGALSGQLSVTTSGATRDAALGNARGSGFVQIDKGRVGALNVLKVLSRASDVLGEKSLRQVSDKLAREGTDFSQLKATLDVGAGKIRSKDLSMTSPDLDMIGGGALDIRAATIDIAGQIVLSETISKAMVEEKSRAVDYFWDTARGRVNLPVTMSGPVSGPSPSIDWGSAGGNLARRKLEEAVRGKLKDQGILGALGERLGKMPEAAPPARSSSPPPIRVASSELGVIVQEQGFSGNPLLPDLKIRGTLNGLEISGATVRVTDESGRVVHEESLAQKLSKYYTNHDRAAPAAINFRVDVDGKRLLGVKGALRVAITVTDAKGGTVTKNLDVSR